MQQESIEVLLVEDSLTDAQLFERVFFRAATGDWKLVHAKRLSEAINYCCTKSFHLALLDLRLPDSEGLATVSRLHQVIPDIPIIILTVSDDEELALEAMAQGAQDYLVKDQVTIQLLRRSIRYAIERSQILQQLKNREREALDALDKERELNQLKSYFVSMVSHEFRNPLSVLRVLSEVLLHYDSNLTVEKKETYSQQINTTVNHMCQLLDEVILLGKVDTGNFEIELSQLHLQDFCEELIASLEYSDKNQHSIILDFQSNLHLIELDAALLRHILSNLISNALKYSPSGSEVRVEVSCLNDKVKFCVSDRGIGIPETDRHRLFETFSRCNNVGKIQGTGLGLAIVKRCVDLYTGEISIESQVGIGTNVTVLLPIGNSAFREN
ncbi:MAG: HAMP domain-containing sensor histidine kinase [Nostoc sp. EfeVER01]|uniref:hybrid sensor histidine kinase/response regulator n=1 Tax=unclassified Nostoc TaxID=2593658 RepID=UPI002AD24657|nr:MULTISPECIES: HAMP domain-containing sensor histidine kinase [unclassified Nostoc]MDZ7947563.1 HAMP domain-containing sensor histidine kinase [Nostoc sp. EfeVER01]MDZ7994209.1 HAMP domain-containing sensor histidine kinase [Nostoc sp. EspVER01]